jgi:glycosyltransferase involved in cell wall biosynthesis
MQLPQISVTIITLNEEQNLPRAIQSVCWADEIIVVDSGSTDRTVEIAHELGAKVFHNPWQGYGQQKNFAQRQASYDWVLNIDADEAVTLALSNEICAALKAADSGTTRAKGFSFPRKTFYLGRWIRYGGWYPNRLVRLCDRRHARWTEPEVHEELLIDGTVDRLKNALDHYSFPSIHDQVVTNLRFSRLGSYELRKRGRKPSLSRLLLKPAGKFMETYLIKRGFLDGLPGLIIAVNAAHSVFLKHAYLMEPEIREDFDNRQ